MSVYFFWNIFLALVWAFAIGQLTLGTLVVGLVLGYVVLWMCRGVLDTTTYCRFVMKLLEFMVYFMWEIIHANLRVAFDVVTPTHYMKPGIIALPLDVKTDIQITLLANLISLTPGSLSLELSTDRSVLYVHAMYIADPEREKQRIKRGLERRLLELST